MPGLLCVLVPRGVACLDELGGLRVNCHEYVSDVGGESVDHLSAVEPFREESVDDKHDVADLACVGEVGNAEVVVGIEDVEVFKHFLVGYVALTVAGDLVEDGEGVAHTAVGFLGYHVECCFLVGVAFFLGNALEVVDHVLHRHPVEVVYLAA